MSRGSWVHVLENRPENSTPEIEEGKGTGHMKPQEKTDAYLKNRTKHSYQGTWGMYLS